MSDHAIICQNCGYENEPQRVYCHNCGEKLDRSRVVKVRRKETPRVANAASSAGRVPARLRHAPPRWRLTAFARTILLGALAASLISLLTPPQKLPPPPPQSLLADPVDLGIVLDRALTDPAVGMLAIPQDQINAYLARHIGAKTSPGLGFMIAWDRAAVELTPGQASVFLVRRVVTGSQPPGLDELSKHFPLVVRADFELLRTSREPGIEARATGGQIGRMRVPGPVMDLLKGVFFGEIARLLSAEIADLGKMSAVSVTDGALRVTPPGPRGSAY